MSRPLMIYKLADLKPIEPLDSTDNWTLRIQEETYRVWLSVDQKTVRVEEKYLDTGAFKVVEEYPAR